MTNLAQIFTDLLFYAYKMLGYTKWEYLYSTIIKRVHAFKMHITVEWWS